MNEVSCKACGVLLAATRQRQIAPERLLDGLPLTLEWINNDGNRIDWDVYAQILERAELLWGGPQELVAGGKLALDNATFHGAYTLAGLFATSRQLYWFGCHWLAPARFPHLQFHYDELDHERVRVRIDIPPAYRASPQFFSLALGAMQIVPRFLGRQHAEAVIDAQITPRCATYTIEAPLVASRWAQMRQRWRMLFGSRAALAELAAQQADLKRHYDETLEEQRRAEAALRQSEEHFRLLIENGLDLIAVLNPDGSIRYVSPSHERVLGFKPAELIGKPVFDLVHPDDVPRVAEAFAEAVERHGDAPAIEFRFRHCNGSWRTIEAVGTVLLDEAGTVSGIINSRDITERKQAEQKTKALLEIAKSISGTVDLTSLLVRVQQQTAAALPCDRVATFGLDPVRNVFRLVSEHGLPPELRREIEAMEFPPGEPFGGRVLRGETLVYNDMTQQMWLSPPMYEHFEIAAFAVAPLRVRDRHFGLLMAVNTTPLPFDTGQVELLEGIARQVGVAIETTELYRVQQAEAEVSGALARAGQEVISALDSPTLLDHLCRLTAELLHCDFSHTWLWEPQEEVYVAAGGYGDPPEVWESIRVLKLSREVLAPMLRGLERDDFTHVTIPASSAPGTAPPYGVTRGFMVALRRGDEVFGIHSAGYRERQAVFTPQQERIARGIAHIASLALDHVRAVTELERANQLKSDFVATMSHELRTPLNVIIGYTDLLREGAFGDLTVDQSHTLGRVENSARELLALINATLDLSRLESGRLSLELTEVRLANLIDELDSETRELRAPSGLTFQWDIDPHLPVLHTDAMKVKVVLKNLISNAVKFTKAGCVAVRVAQCDGGVECTVSDTGIGIEPDAMPIIFEPFRQAGSWIIREYGGVGLGLYIVRRLVGMLGGTVTADSELGRGSTFRVWLPLTSGTYQTQAVGLITTEQ